MPPTPPPPPPAPEPAAPLPPPTSVSAGEKDAAKVQKRTSARAALQQASGGASNLRIPLATGGAGDAAGGPAKKPGGSLNIPK